ncbi:hypothetical protein GQ53DRAFT_833688 [Thozetella sp. PMI_491]|nr:hypothetical protein GQ53DRAFT_833688 [Thozetella sp. PMI_491]
MSNHNLDHEAIYPYKALSYVWGSPRTTEEVVVENETYHATINLSCALRYLRRTDKPITLWVDALCINQRNLGERRFQVQMMREIFAKAQEVVFAFSPLGTANGESRFLKTPTHDSGCISLKCYKDWSLHPGGSGCGWSKRLQSRNISAFSSAASQLLRSYLLLLSEAWPSLKLDIENDHLKVASPFTRQVSEVENLRRRWEYDRGSSLLSLLQEFLNRRASDERDKVYALLGLTKAKDTLATEYTITIDKVYERTAVAVINENKSLSVLFGDLQRKNRHSLPSWVPDWSAIIERSDLR